MNYLKITIKTAVGVYLPENGGASRAALGAVLRNHLQTTADWWSDGRKRFQVEQLQTAAELIVRDAIERAVTDHFGAGGLQAAQLEDDIVLAMSRVSVAEVSVSDEHVLEFEIEDDADDIPY